MPDPVISAAPALRPPFATQCRFSTIAIAMPLTSDESCMLALAGDRYGAIPPCLACLQAHLAGHPYAFVVGGLVLIALVAIAIQQAHRRAERIEELVTNRTRALQRAEAQLREDVDLRRRAEERYRAFLEHTTEAIWRLELDEPISLEIPEDAQLELLYRGAWLAECNDAFAHMHGFERSKEMIGLRLPELLPREAPGSLEQLRTFIRGRFRATDAEFTWRGSGDRTRVFLTNVVGIAEQEKIVRIWGTQRDITGQRRAEEARAENERRLRVAMSAGDLGAWEWDQVRDRFVWSEQLYTMFGVEPGRFAGTFQAFLDCVHPDDRKRVREAALDALQAGGEFEFEYRTAHPEDPVRWVVSRGEVRHGSDGSIIGMLGVAVDVTARKRDEEERVRIEQKLQETQKLESLGVLAGGIAHDFNNLLTGILGNASLGRMDLPSNSPVQANLAQIELAAQRAADLCKQMLAYSGKGRFVVQGIDLSKLVDDAIPLLQISVSKNATLRYRLASGLPAANADATQLRQILMNLVINASDAIGETSGVIEITTGVMHASRAYFAGTHLSPSLPDGQYVFLEVTDTGCGMSAETQKRIFDPFYTTKFTGRGLGLAAVLGIVRGHNGALKVQSEVGKGSAFRLLLPATEMPPEPTPPMPGDDAQWRGSGLILVVDDEPTVRAVTERMLKTMGFDVIVAENGVEGVAAFQEHAAKVRAVLLDLTMPQMNGTQAFIELRRIRKEIKVVLMSGFNEQDAINRFEGQGLSGFLQKPFNSEALRARMHALFATED